MSCLIFIEAIFVTKVVTSKSHGGTEAPLLGMPMGLVILSYKIDSNSSTDQIEFLNLLGLVDCLSSKPPI